MAPIGLALVAVLAAASATALEPRPSNAPPAGPKASAAITAQPASTQSCCADPFASVGANGERPLSITIESGLQVGRLGLTGHADGNAAIDPQTGAKQIGQNMIDLGGVTFQGKATITGQPLKPVRIDLPHTVLLHSPSGSEAELSNFRTDLPALAMLDANGVLQFNFGATISSKDGQGGDFRGRIPIRVEYY
jgi:hypothetical protein